MSEVKFEPFQRVLVRDFDHNEWKINFFEEKCADYFFCLVGHWKQCLPYNDETKHLLGTTDSPTPPEPEFKWGDHVQVSEDNFYWLNAIYLSNVGKAYQVVTVGGKSVELFVYCRHADW